MNRRRAGGRTCSGWVGRRSCKALLACAAIAAIAITAAPASAAPGQPGSLDPSFGTSGTATVSFAGGTSEQFNAVATQADGKIVAVGTSSQSSTGEDFAVARLNPDGSPDTTFGSAGKVTIDLGSQRDEATGVALQANGEILVAGVTGTGAHQIGVVRLSATGTLDTTFNNTGKLVLGPGSANQNVVRVAVQPTDQQIVLAGSGPTNSTTGFQLKRLTTAGQLDPTFGYMGTVSVVVAGGASGYSVATGLAIQGDGGIVVGGYGNAVSGAPFDFQAARFTTFGALDSTFNPSGAQPGTRVVSFGQDATANALTLHPADGRIVLAGESGSASGCVNGAHTALVRLNPDGSPDVTFGASGKVSVAVPSATYDCANAVTIDVNGRILTAGSAYLNGDNQMAIGRFTTDGAPDQSFGDPGWSNLGPGVGHAVAPVVNAQGTWALVFGAIGPTAGPRSAGAKRINDGLTTGGGPPVVAGADLAVEFLVRPPAHAQIGSPIHFSVRVVNRGTARSPAGLALDVSDTSSSLLGARVRSNFYSSKFSTSASNVISLPSLAPNAAGAFAIASTPNNPTRLFTGAATFTVTIPADGDPPGDDLNNSAGPPNASAPADASQVQTGTDIGIAGASFAGCPRVPTLTIPGAAVCTYVHGRARLFVGSATGDVRQVQLAVESALPVVPAPRAKPQCRALTGAGGRLLLTPPTNGVCNQVQWLTASGTAHWHLLLASSLPPGRYVLYTRPVTTIGTPVTGFSAARHNRLAFIVR